MFLRRGELKKPRSGERDKQFENNEAGKNGGEAKSPSARKTEEIVVAGACMQREKDGEEDRWIQ